MMSKMATLNPSKSKLVLFSKCPQHKEEVAANGLTIQLFQEQITTVDEADCLGVTFDTRMTWEPQTKKMISRSYQRLNLIRMISSISNKSKPENLLKIYESTIRSIFEYSSLCIINAAETHLDKLQLIQNQALRIVLSTPAYISIGDLHDCSGTKRLKDHLKDFARKRLNSLMNTSPIIAETIDDYRKVQHILENASTLDVLGI